MESHLLLSKQLLQRVSLVYGERRNRWHSSTCHIKCVTACHQLALLESSGHISYSDHVYYLHPSPCGHTRNHVAFDCLTLKQVDVSSLWIRWVCLQGRNPASPGMCKTL